MKKFDSRVLNFVIVIACSFLLSAHLKAQETISPIKIVFDVTSADVKIHKAVLRHVKGVATKYPDAKVAIVIYGGGLAMIQKNVSEVADDLKQLATSKAVSFEVCQIALNNKNISPDELIDGVKIVPDAIIELVELQAKGYAYIKETN